jgi:hypothetical protein
VAEFEYLERAITNKITLNDKRNFWCRIFGLTERNDNNEV